MKNGKQHQQQLRQQHRHQQQHRQHIRAQLHMNLSIYENESTKFLMKDKVK